MEATLMAIGRQMDKEVVLQIHNGMLLSYKKEHVWVIYNEIDETGAYYTEWSKSERETQILYMVLEEAEEPEVKLSTSEGSLKK